MRKVWKKQIKDFLNLMEEAHNEIEKEVEINFPPDFQKVYFLVIANQMLIHSI